jgi:hypothetical protein
MSDNEATNEGRENLPKSLEVKKNLCVTCDAKITKPVNLFSIQVINTTKWY